MCEPMRTQHIVTIVCSAVVIVACGGSPTAPSVTTQPSAGGGSPQSQASVEVSGRVIDTAGLPVADARVEQTEGASAGAVATTDAAGEFSLPPASGGTVVGISVAKPGYVTATVRRVLPSRLGMVLSAERPLDLSGAWAITFTADAQCTDLLPEYRTRRYTATLLPHKDRPAQFVADVHGADMVPLYDQFVTAVASDRARFMIFSRYAFDSWLEDQPVIERLPSGGMISVSGTALVTGFGSGRPAASDLDGTVSYCAEPRPPVAADFPPTCGVAPVRCASQHHRFELAMR
jgi:hypothetical protein